MPRKTGKPGHTAHAGGAAEKIGDAAKKESDAALWQRVAAGARPLDPAKRNRSHQAPAVPAPVPKHDPPEAEPASRRVAPGRVAPASDAARKKGAAARKTPAPVAVGHAARGQAPGLDRRLAERLRRGELPLEGRLDLHGMTRAAARAALDRFLADAAHAGRRAILVITGKGRRSAPDDHGRPSDGVLRRELPGWLGTGGNRALVLAWAPARPRDGGEGAVYVLLRRRRDESSRR